MDSPVRTEHVGQLEAVGGQWLGGQVHRGRREGEGWVHGGYKTHIGSEQGKVRQEMRQVDRQEVSEPT